MITFKDLVSQIIVNSNLVENNIAVAKVKKVEEQEQFKFPTDYVKFIRFYGTGRLSQLLWILNPLSEYDRFNLLAFLTNQKQVFDQLKREYDAKYPYKLFQNKVGLLPFAFTDNGDTIYWNIKDISEEFYSIIILDGRSMKSEEHDVSFVEFLDKFLNKSLNSAIILNEDIITKSFDPLDKRNFNV
jgi:hypothetical protein